MPNNKYLGVTFYFRNNSTGRPTLRHILNSEGNSYCGWKGDFGAEVFVSDESDSPTDLCICKKCLRLHEKQKSKPSFEVVEDILINAFKRFCAIQPDCFERSAWIDEYLSK